MAHITMRLLVWMNAQETQLYGAWEQERLRGHPVLAAELIGGGQ
jgi:hypothetical protein